jgi:N-methylhydantoinase A/oxoprolinase/acetone carboxylase beta subunit
MAPAATAQRYPVRLFESGPAAGITATARLTTPAAEFQHLVAFDMGGTTAKFCVIDGGQPSMTWDLEVDRAERFSSGSGLPLKIPSFEMIEIGAGGGSLAYINELGLLKVGPESAGSTPGPSCYGRGGTEPTVTDALLVLGYLDPDYFLGGKLTLDLDAAVAAIDKEVGASLGLSTEDAALGIFRIACGQMAEAMRVQLAERGKDPRRYSLVAFGGAGPVHAAEVARQLKVPRVVVPPAAGIMSAYGLLMAPLAFGVTQSYPTPIGLADFAKLEEQLAVLGDRVQAMLRDAGVPEGEIELQRALDMKYVGQKHSLEVPLSVSPLDPAFTSHVQEEFERLYIEQHGRANRGLELFLESIKIRGLGPVEPAAALADRPGRDRLEREERFRGVRFLGEPEVVQTRVVRRAELPAGVRLAGPAIVEEPETTTVIGPDDSFEIDERNNLVVSIGSAGGVTLGEDLGEARVGISR